MDEASQNLLLIAVIVLALLCTLGAMVFSVGRPGEISPEGGEAEPVADNADNPQTDDRADFTSAPAPAPAPGDSALSPLGVVCMIAGVLVLFWAFSADVSVSVAPVYVPYGGMMGGGEVSNVSLLSQRSMIFDGGVGLVILGAIFLCAGIILNEVRRRP